MIEIRNLFLKYIREYYALYDINMAVAEGERVALVGAEQSGKTSLLRIICKLQKPTSGEVYVKDIPIEKLNLAEDINLAFLPETPVFLPKKTVYENLQYLLSVRKIPTLEAEKQINEKLIEFNIESLRDVKVKDLTLVEKYIVSLVRFSFRKIEIALIDNIFDGLTDEENERVVRIIQELFIDKNITLLVATTNAEIAKFLCETIYYFQNGSIVKSEGKNADKLKEQVENGTALKESGKEKIVSQKLPKADKKSQKKDSTQNSSKRKPLTKINKKKAK